MDEKFFENDEGFASKLRTFDAFPKTRSHYTTRTTRGGLLTLLLVFSCILLIWVELGVYLDGIEEQHFTIAKAIGHTMQINIDITVAMPCDYLHVNVQDAVGDRLLAGDILHKEDEHTPWDHLDTVGIYNVHRYDTHDNYKHEDMWHQLAKNQKSPSPSSLSSLSKKKEKKDTNSCRIFGSLNVNKVQGDFHITAKGHGYWDPLSSLGHIDHDKFNFSHVIQELSFGEYYPKLINPLDDVLATTEKNFWKFQYFLSVVPTVYRDTVTGHVLDTNQYSVTEHSREVSPTNAVPGIFFKFDVEPISLFVTDSRTSLVGFMVRLINIIGGVLVSGGWFYKLFDTVMAFFKKQQSGEGMLNGRILHV